MKRYQHRSLTFQTKHNLSFICFVQKKVTMDLHSFFLAFTLTFIVTAVVYIKWSLSYWSRMGVQTLRPRFLIGNALSLLTCKENIGIFVLKLTEHYKRLKVPFCGFYFCTKPIFVPITPDLIKKILITDFEHFADRPFTNDESDPLSVHLFALKVSKWKQLRTKLAPAFTKAKKKMMLPTVKVCVDNCLEVLDKLSTQNEVIEIKDLSTRLVLDVLASCSFGLEINGVKNTDSEFAFYAKEYFNSSVRDTIVRLLSILSPELLPVLKIKSIRNDITEFYLKTVDSTIKYRERNNVVRNDLMHIMLQIKNNVQIVDGETGDIRKTKNQADSLSITDIAAQCFVFMVAGYESSSSAVSFCLYELSLQQSYQDKAREEIANVVAEHNGEINYEVLSNIPYIEKCVKETMRKYPVLPALFRTCTKNYRLPDSNVVLKKGTICLISTLGLHYDPEMYPNPQEFDPERFSDENVSKRHSMSWIPFGDGPRICIAYQFGLMNVKLTLATLLLNYKFSLNPKTEVPIVLNEMSFTTSPKNSIWLNLEKIT